MMSGKGVAVPRWAQQERGGLVHLVRGATRATTELKEALVAAASKAEVQPVRAAAPPRRCAVHRGRGRF